LAEVLITLAIIGVVAAITIPTLVANHQKRTLETQFAKAYRNLQQVINLAIAENGSIETWDWKTSYTDEDFENFAQKYLFPYMNIQKNCKRNGVGCFYNGMYKFLDGTDWINLNNEATHKFITTDGMGFGFNLKNCTKVDQCFLIRVDVNGHEKPNILGRDVFTFDYYPIAGGLVPEGMWAFRKTTGERLEKNQKVTREEVEANCNAQGGTKLYNSSAGGMCGARIAQDGFKMNY